MADLMNYGNGIASFGIPVLGGGGVPPFPGTYYFVKPYSGSDARSGKTPAKALKTLAEALNRCTANKHDVVFMISEGNTAALASDYQATALNWNKDGVHLIGIGSAPVMGQRSRIAQLSTALTIEDLFTVSADNCLIANLEIFQGVDGSTATSPRAMVVSGQRNRIVNCQISGMGDATSTNTMDTAGACSLAVIYPGSENTFQHCYIGLDTIIKATATAEVRITGTGTGTRVARTVFEDCIFATYTSTATMKMVIHTYTDRFVLYKNCTFLCANAASGAVAITGAFGQSDINGMIAVHGSSSFNIGDWTTADDATVFVSSFGGRAADATKTVEMGNAVTVDVTA